MSELRELYLGLDIGSTTVKAVLLDAEGNKLFSVYQRHFSDIKQTLDDVLRQISEHSEGLPVHITVSGSGGLGLSQILGLPFYQEVAACAAAVEHYIPQTDVVIELGGEDAKIIYFGKNGIEQRMNGACAGGTGAFIDQMASLLQTDAAGLNELARRSEVLYPIASRCGVFAKMDIQPLINQGAAAADIAASVFRAVVNQTIVGLAAGKPIRGNVAFLGGPLHYLDQLTASFKEVLALDDDSAIIPADGQYYVALGAALKAMQKNDAGILIDDLCRYLSETDINTVSDADALPVLFADEEEYRAFRARHDKHKAPALPLEECNSPMLFVGIDAGSTTTKAVLIDMQGNIIYSRYGSNMGDPIKLSIDIMQDIYRHLPEDVYIANVGVTGYGEELIKAAINADFGEVETLAHYRAARQFMPEVDFILDIGGQDMKAIRVRDGIIDDIILNEACSSGCGSFIETFAASLGLSVQKFAAAALRAKRPVDMGSRCTVFMNSKVKQAQKEGATVEDISAGLSYSVVKNALYKVIKLRRAEEFGKNVLLQGGTFKNEAILRAFEKETGINAVCPDIAGLMGAYGVALLAVERWLRRRHSHVLSVTELEDLAYEQSFSHCGKCTNNCLLTHIKFSTGKEFISGNRCERGGIAAETMTLAAPNLFDYEYKRVFDYKPNKNAPLGKIGVPRSLNMYDNYPFWHTLLTALGFEVVLSPISNKKLFEKGMESIPSEAVCYPAKLVHGHIESLLQRDIKHIFYPCVMYESKEYKEANNHYNCPVVSGYPEVIAKNVDAFIESDRCIIRPFVNFDDKKKLLNALVAAFGETGFKFEKKAMERAIKFAYAEQAKFKNDIKVKTQETLEFMEDRGLQGIILAGRPYHLDPEINHGIPNLFSQAGIAVLTVTGAAQLASPPRPLRVVDQWVFHSRLYAAAQLACERKELGLVQLVSFGCGLDAITADQVSEILHRHNKLYSSIKIDEGDNLGAARIRVRSLGVAMAERSGRPETLPSSIPIAPRFEKSMKDAKYTILGPQMAPMHFQFLEAAFKSSGYQLKILPEVSASAKEAGLKYVHNDACYPCLLTTGQFIDALQSGEYDVNKTAVIMSQTGGQCRATNYIGLIRKALDDAGFKQVPVISLSISATQKQPGFRYTVPMVLKLVMSIVYGDIFMKLMYRLRPYAKDEKALNVLYDKWVAVAKRDIAKCSWFAFRRHQKQIIAEFDAVELRDEKKPRVGIVGEILVKFSPDANNNAAKIVESLGGEVVMPALLDFFMYGSFGNYYRSYHIEGGLVKRLTAKFAIDVMEYLRRPAEKAYKKSRHFTPDAKIFDTAEHASEVVSIGHSAGEGWFLTGEMLELLDEGVNNIICVQPFACLPNHITGRGMIKELRRKHPEANIVAVDYDPGASETNQLNRIKLMMEQALRQL